MTEPINILGIAAVLKKYSVIYNLVSKVVLLLVWFCFTNTVNQSEAKPKPIMPRSHTFSRAWRRLHAFASDFDWLIALFSSVVIG